MTGVSVVGASARGSVDTSGGGLPLENAVHTALIAGTAGILIPILVTRLKKVCATSPSESWVFRCTWVGAFLVNLITVGIPGRFDSESTRETSAAKKSGTILSFTPIFAPSGWAFAIWGVIYLGEMILTVFTAIWGGNAPWGSFLKEATPYWVGANAFQSLWCAAFRPKFKKMLWLPSLCLVLAAFLQLRCLYTIMKSSNDVDSLVDFFSSSMPENIAKFAMAFPIALHGGWLTAAALLNLNSFATESGISMGLNIAMAFLSTYGAALISMYATAKTHNPFVMGTIAWALAAVAHNIKNNKTAQAAKLNEDTQEALHFTISGVSKSLLVLSPVLANVSPLRSALEDAIF